MSKLSSEEAQKKIISLLESFGFSYNYSGTKFPKVDVIQAHPGWKELKGFPKRISSLSMLARFIPGLKESEFGEFFSNVNLKNHNSIGLEKALYAAICKNPSWSETLYAAFNPGHIDRILWGKLSLAERLYKNRKDYEGTGFGRFVIESQGKDNLKTFETFIHSIYMQNLYSNSRAFFGLLDVCIGTDIELAFDKKSLSASLSRKDFFLRSILIEPLLIQSFVGFWYFRKSFDINDSRDRKLISSALINHDKATKSKIFKGDVKLPNFGLKGSNTSLMRALFLIRVFEEKSAALVEDSDLIKLLSGYGLCQLKMNRNTFKGIRVKILRKNIKG
jgi:hypothetical protein